MTDTRQTVSAFYSNIEAKNFDALETLLHEDLDFQGPMDRFENSAGLIAKLTQAAGVTKGFEMKHLFVDGDRACAVYDLLTHTPLEKSPVCEYLEVRDGRITCIRAHYDALPWVKLFSAQGG